MNVFVWRADARNADWEDARVVVPKTGPKQPCNDKGGDCDWTADTVKFFKWLIAVRFNWLSAEQAEGAVAMDRIRERRHTAMERIEQRLDPKKPLEGEDKMAKIWADQASSPPTQKDFEKSHAEQWRITGCAAEGAPYVVRALLERLYDPNISRFAKNSPEVPKLAAAFLDKDCAGARGLSEAEIAKLNAIRDRAPPPAPKP